MQQGAAVTALTSPARTVYRLLISDVQMMAPGSVTLRETASAVKRIILCPTLTANLQSQHRQKLLDALNFIQQYTGNPALGGLDDNSALYFNVNFNNTFGGYVCRSTSATFDFNINMIHFCI